MEFFAQEDTTNLDIVKYFIVVFDIVLHMIFLSMFIAILDGFYNDIVVKNYDSNDS